MKKWKERGKVVAVLYSEVVGLKRFGSSGYPWGVCSDRVKND